MPGDVATASHDALRAKVLLVHERLCAIYECPIRYLHDLDPLSELVSSLLSHRTKNADSGRAFRALRDRFATWEQVPGCHRRRRGRSRDRRRHVARAEGAAPAGRVARDHGKAKWRAVPRLPC